MSHAEKPKRTRLELAWMGVLAAGGAMVAVSTADLPINTTVADFFNGGSQPGDMVQRLASATGCQNCHSYYDEVEEPFRPWAASMMGQSARDPVFWAALAIAQQDVNEVADFCLRCHVPQGWIEGRGVNPGQEGLTGTDFQGVSCSACHRMVDPVYTPGESPAEDELILLGVSPMPVNPGNANYILDPLDRRRGPFELTFTPHGWLESPFHTKSQMCATCHEVSNPVFVRQPDGTYAIPPNSLGQPHPTLNKYDMAPEQRTFSEWLNSEFSQGPLNLGNFEHGGVDMGNRFGGNNPAVSQCQDCHMPSTEGIGCDPAFETPVRPHMPQHHFAGANTWVLRAVRSLFDDGETGLEEATVEQALQRVDQMLKAASDVVLLQQNNQLLVRVINQTGHKLPTGYPEGRRMWVNVRFYDGNNTLIAERGAYDAEEAVLNEDTKVYEAKMGIDAAVAALTGVPEGPTFHLALNNTFYKDNRIPPRGFTNAAFAAVQAAPVNSTYEDGQFWDDTLYFIPYNTASIEVRTFYQTTTREYIEFLRDANTTPGNTAGQTAYDQWVLHGKSAPAEMDLAFLTVGDRCRADMDNSDSIDDLDILAFFSAFEEGDPRADLNADDGIDDLDIALFFALFEQGC